MIVFDQLRKGDPQLRVLTLMIVVGLSVLLAGLWWVQIVSARDYRESLETQSFRTVRIPAVRGKILDRNGAVLAENRPTYNVSLYLEELRKAFARDYVQNRPTRVVTNYLHFWQRWLGAETVKTQRARLSKAQIEALSWQSRCRVASNVVWEVSRHLREPIPWDPALFQRHYATRRALPFTVLANLNPTSIARFEEQLTNPMGVDLEVESTRFYPCKTTAAHLLGQLRRDNSSAEGEEAFFSYRLPDYRGLVGIEWGFDKELRGLAGAKSVLVNNLGYRQTENVWIPAEPGSNVVLTIDLHIQQAAEQALQGVFGPTTCGAVVVMDVHTGDVLAMASSPTLDPNIFVQGLSSARWRHIQELHAEKNRATQENYMPGSIFKTVVGLAALEAGWNPNTLIHVLPNPSQPTKGHVRIGRHTFRDTAPPGDYDFKRALKLSSNSYFIECGLRIGPERIIRMAERVHLGERTGLPTRQEVSGSIPSLRRLKYGWTDGNTGNISIGQDPIWVTPIQIAVLASAIANGGKVLWPRLVDRIEAPDPALGAPALVFPSARVRDKLGVSARTLRVMRDAMLGDTEDPDGTGTKAAVPGLRICAKTGTAQVQDVHNVNTGHTTWFASFAPYEKPQWAVVVMVENGRSGGSTCAPVAKQVYTAILESRRKAAARPQPLARRE